MKTIREMALLVPGAVVRGDKSVNITGIEHDSRKVERGTLFVCIPGVHVDGHDFIPQAEAAGARAILTTREDIEPPYDGAVLQVPDLGKALDVIVPYFYDYPSRNMRIIGITGTNGKTTTSYIIRSLLRAAGYKVGLIGTIQIMIEDEKFPIHNTTPDVVELQHILANMRARGMDYVVMEVSSHALAQNRVAGIEFDTAVFTNLTQDHLDYHKTFENYIKAKKLFFDRLPKEAFAITNVDDKNGLVMVQNTKAVVKTYSVQSPADFKAKIIECHFEGMYLNINGREVGVQFIGKFNVSNLLAVFGTAVMLGKDPEEVLVALSKMKPVNGRFEALRSPKGFTAIVDYAHTPDALENVLSAIHGVLEGKGQVITVCGAGGNRDKGKRPLMAREAVKQSDKVILTSDNPRFEEPEDILNDMLAGLNEEQMQKVITIVDRRQAIKTACMLAQEGDVILIAGKGHEDYQIIKGVKHHFDDKEEVRACFTV